MQVTQKELPLSTVYKTLLSDTETIKKYKDDSESIEVKEVYKVHFNQYIGEKTPFLYPNSNLSISPLRAILSLLKHESRLMLQSNAGTGKSTLLLSLVGGAKTNTNLKNSRELESPNLEMLQNIGIEKLLILEPTTPITQQLGEDFKKQYYVPYVDGQVDKFEIEQAKNSNVVICCYDSLSKIEGFITPKTLVVVDEFHQLVIDYDFREKSRFNYLIDNIYKGKVLFMSATPLYYFCLPLKLNSKFGFKLVIGKAKIQQQIQIQPLKYKGRRKDTPAYIIKNHATKDTLTAIKFDSFNNISDALRIAHKQGLRASVFSSKERKYKEGNENYKSLMQNGVFKDKLNVILYTTLLEAGVSIKEEIKEMFLIDSNQWNRTIQLMSRARYNHKTGVNKIIKVNILEREATQQVKRPKYKHVTQRLYNKIREAEELAKHKNNFSNGELSEKLHTDTEKVKYLTRTNENGEDEPNILYILHEINKEGQNVDNALTIKRITRFDNRVQVLPTKTIEIPQDKDVKDLEVERKEKDEQEQLRLLEVLKKDPNTTLQYFYKNARNKEVKENLNRAFIGLFDVIDNTKIEIFKKHNNISTLSLISEHIKKITFLAEKFRTLKLSDLSRLIAETDAKEIDEIIQNTAKSNRNFLAVYDKKNLSRNDRVFYERDKTVRKKLSQILIDQKRGKGKEWRTAEQWTTIINSAIKKTKLKCNPITKHKALKLIRSLSELEEKRTKKAMLYKLEAMKKTHSFEELEKGLKGNI